MKKVLRTVSVSGGKDSTCVYLLAIDRFGKGGFRAVFANTGNEHPVTLNYLRNLPKIADGPEIEWVSADFTEQLAKKGLRPTGSVFKDLILWKGRVPSRRAQFCTEQLKILPMAAWLERIRGDSEVVQYDGLRAGESEARAKRKFREWAKTFDCWSIHPILRWSEERVFAFAKSRGVPLNPLYENGFGRVGCYPCVNCGKRELSRLEDWAWDKITDWERAVKAISGRGSWFRWGMLPPTPEQKAELDKLPPEIDSEDGEPTGYPDPVAYGNLLRARPEWMPRIEDVREWAKTTRGGVQFDLFAQQENNDVPSCTATWGICE